MRSAHQIMLCLLFPATVFAGELKTTIISVAQTCVGQELSVSAKVENINASFSVSSVITTTRVKQGATVLATKTSSPYNLAPSSSKTETIQTGWIATATGAYTVEVSADGVDDINGPQISTSPFTVCASAPCPERPTASGNVIYLGTGSTGSISYTAPPTPCCYEIKVTIVTGRDAITDRSPQSWTAVGSSASVSVTVNRAKMNAAGYMLLRVDWRKCDRTSSGSDYVLVRDGTQQAASAPTTPPVGTTAGQTPQSGTDGDPVMTATREFALPVDVIDAEALARLPIGMGRTYLSLLETVVKKDHDFGPGWTHPYEWNAVVGDGEAYVHGPSGFAARFRKTGSTWTLDWPKNGAYSFSNPTPTIYAFGDAGRDIVVMFNENGRLSTIGNSFGYMNTVNWDGRWITSIKAPSGNGITLTRDTTGLITSLTNGVKTVSYGYTNGYLEYFQDGKGNRTNYTYAPGTSYLTSWRTPEGRTPLINTYDAQGHVAKQDMGDGFVVDFSFLNNKTSITYPGGVTTTHTHDAKNQLTEVKNPLGAAASFTYDANGNRTGVTDMEGGAVTRTFTNGLMSGTTLVDGPEWGIDRNTRTYQGLSMADVEAIGVIDKPSFIISRNADGTPKDMTAPNGWQTKFEYTGSTMPSRIYDLTADNRYTYNVDGLVTSWLNKGGTQYTLARDASGRITGLTIDATTTQFQYDANQDLTGVLNGTSQQRWAFDKDRELSSYTDADNRMWSRVLDLRGRVIEVKNPTATGVKYTWTGPIMTGMEFGDGVKYSFTPSLSGLPSGITDEAGNTWGLNYNNEGRPVKLTLPDGKFNTYDVDGAGRTIGITSPLGRKFEYGYDAMGVMDRYRAPGVVPTDVTRNGAYTTGSISASSISLSYESKYAGGKFTSSITDGQGYKWIKEIDGATTDETYTSPSGAKTLVDVTGDNRVSSVEWGINAKATYQYTGRNLTGIQIGSASLAWQLSPGGLVTNFNNDPITRDGAGRVTKQNGVEATRTSSGVVSDYTFESLKIAKYEYDIRGYVSGVEDSKGGKTKVNIDSRGRMTGLDFPGGLTLNYDWNDDGQVAKVSTSDGWSLMYERDAQGRVTSRTRTDNVPLHTLTTPLDLGYAYNNDNKLEGATYDNFGNYTTSPGSDTEFDYGGFGLKGLTFGGMDWTIDRDAYGYPNRIGDKIAAVNIDFNVIPTFPNPIRITLPSGASTIVQLPNGRPLYGIDAAGNRTFFIDDGLGSILQHRNDAGTVTSSRIYSPYGAVIGESGVSTSFGYKGLEGGFTLTNGRILLGRDIYEPQVGRYLNRIGVVPYPANTDPRSHNPQIRINDDFNEGPEQFPFVNGGLYSESCDYYDGDLFPPDDWAPDYVKIARQLGSGFYYLPGTETVVRMNGRTSPLTTNDAAADALKLGYGITGGYYVHGGLDLILDDPQPGIDFDSYNIHVKDYDLGYRIDFTLGGYPDPSTAPTRYYPDADKEEAELGLYLDKIFGGLNPSTGPLVTPTPTPTPQPLNDTQTKK